MQQKLYSFIFFMLLINSGFAQEFLSLENAIKLGVENEFAIKIAKNNQAITKAQNNFGNAGMSPIISLSAGGGGAIVNSKQDFSSGATQQINGAASSNINAALNVNWTIFDGLKMFAIKKRLAGNEMLSKYELKVQLENTVAAIIVAYCDIVRIDEQIKAAKQNLSLYEERKKIAKMRFDIGSSSKVDFLLSQTDLNRAKTDLLQLELQLTNAKATLNNLMARPIDIDFSATDSIVISYQPNLEDLKKNSLQNNSQLSIAKQNEYNLQQQIKEAKAFYYPTIQLNGSYNFIRNQSQAGFVFLNQQNGLNGNLALNWTLFNGLKNMRNLKEKQINFLNQQINTQKTKLLIDATVYINYQNYIANQKILDFEKQNLTDAKELIFISQERFKEGKTTILETIEVQKKYEEAQAKYINALYAAKKAETELLKTNGILVDQKLY